MKESVETQKLMDLCEKLPEVNQTYILDLNKSTTTKIIYAYELIRFNDYLKEKKEKTFINYRTYSEISYDDIQDYFRVIINKGNEYNTVQRARTALNGWFNALNDIHAVNGNPVCSGKALEKLFWEMTGKEPGDKENKTVPDMAGFLDVIANGTGLSDFQKKHHKKHRLRDMAIVALILDTGIKVSELNALNTEDYDRNFSLLYVQKRAVKINVDTKKKLNQYIDQERIVVAEIDSRQSPLFVATDGKRLAVRSIQSILKKYSVAGNSSQAISAEKLREISAERYYQETGDVQGLKERLGVKSMVAVEKYISQKES